MKIALVHDYLTQQGGAERVFELLCQYFPTADIFTALYEPTKTIVLDERSVHTTFLQKLPKASHYFRLLAPLYFPAFRSLNLQSYDLIISSTSSFAKAVKKNPNAKHICFCHNVTRFLWDTSTYLNEYKDYQTWTPVIRKIFEVMRKDDLRYAKEPDIYIANSSVVAQRIQNIYGQDSIVINYPIDSSKFQFSERKNDFFLVSSRMLSYKRIDLIVEAFNWLGWPLLVIGDGPERQYLESKALDNIKFLGYVSDEMRAYLMSQALSVIVAAFEDYGLVPIEANISGTPVVAYGAGGVLDTQISGKTGILFQRQTPESLQSALVEVKEKQWNYAKIRDHAMSNFSQEAFFKKIKAVMQIVLEEQVIL
ncbi:glycosyltransferase [Chroococcus sp. FPU101]|uniref:glycosyltransferase n=1 Tax=Chroococcus sp. FPU101 TaxID=1974212 RepID=UPI001A8DBF6B|nr:glycosyltransferase [Chroococcus sp. FPU101]GFE68222.1 Glycosyl transferase, group 1 [Chroococcus sp. FPU101]